jgi:Tol biopolymer transport system component
MSRCSCLCIALLFSTLACKTGSVTSTGEGNGSGGGSGGGGHGGGFTISTGAPVATPTDPSDAVEPCPDDKCTDFPKDPVFADGTSSGVASQFSGSASGSGPCISEPEDGTLLPYNWQRPRISWTGGSSPTQITLHTDMETNDLVAYTNKSSWTMDKAIWDGLIKHVRDKDVTVTVRSASGGASTSKFHIAPSAAGGKIVFWSAVPSEVGKDPSQAKDTDSYLSGYTMGDDSTVMVLKTSQVKQPSLSQDGHNARKVLCIGCHAATPDSSYIAFTDHWPWNSAIAGIKKGEEGAQLPNLSAGGLIALNLAWAGTPTFSKAHWEDGKRLMVTISSLQDPTQPWSTDNLKPAKLVWYNLDSPEPPLTNGQKFAVKGQQFGEIARSGDSNGAACPSWSHNGETIVYSSTNGGNQDGRLNKGATNLWSVPFNNGDGGTAKAISGASESAWEEYYPAFSPDDKYLLFNRVPSGQIMYANQQAEIFVIPSSGGTATKLRANTPNSCSKKTSPGVNNHFPKWSPTWQVVDGKTYYWIIFSSNQADIPPATTNQPQAVNKQVMISQLYMTAMVVDSSGNITTYPAVYLWTQDPTTVNTTPVWENLEIPRVIL